MDTGLTVTHPLSGQQVPLWVGNYVLMSYGDGAVMGVPAHDERDFEFANKYGLPIRQVIDVNGQAFSSTEWHDWYSDKDNGRTVNSGKYDGMTSAETIDAVAADLIEKGLGEKKVTWRLRDWGISRQRFWGTPIPIIHCPDCGPVPVPESDLPVLLPEELVPDGSGNPLEKHEPFLKCQCPKCGTDARRETDTMDTFVDSSWYFMRYTSPDNHEAMIDERNDYWMPMDQYIGGIEHAILHLLYARFWTRVMRDLGLVNFDEPFTRLLTQGMVLNHTYYRRTPNGGIEYFSPDDVKNTYDDHGAVVSSVLKSDGQPVSYAGIGTMSKSKNNGVDPQSLIDTLGADTARLFTIFASPPEQTLEWSTSGVEGAHRFLRRVWTYCHQHGQAIREGIAAQANWADADKAVKDLRRDIHLNLRQADYDYQRIQYNTVVSTSMKMLNSLESAKLGDSAQANAAVAEGVSILLHMLYPVVPHITWHLWRELGYADVHGDLLDAPWPQVDESALVADQIELVLQVNGKLRGSIQVPASASKDDIESSARQHDATVRFLEGREPKRIIVVPGKLVNVVG